MSNSPRHPHDLNRDPQQDPQGGSIDHLLSDHFERVRLHQSDRGSINDHTSTSEFDEMWRTARVGSRSSSREEVRREKRHKMLRAPSSSRGLSLSFAALCLIILIGVASVSQLKSTHSDKQLPMYSSRATSNAHLSKRPSGRLHHERSPQERSHQESSLHDSFMWSDGWLESDEWSIDESAYSSL